MLIYGFTYNQSVFSLSYQVATFRRTIVFFVISLTFLSAFLFLKFKPQAAMSDTVEGPPVQKILLGIAALFLMFYALSDAFFVLKSKYFQKQVDFDRSNLYIRRKNEVVTIPLEKFTEVFYSMGGRTTVRGAFCKYDIRYMTYDEENELSISVFYKMRENLVLFEKRVKERNPLVMIRTWDSGSEWLRRLFFGTKNS
jgi:hypothetical protein